MEFKRNRIIIVLVVVVLLSLAGNILMYTHYENKYAAKFSLLSPDIAWMDTNEFLSIQNQYSIKYQGMKTEMLGLINKSTTHGIYGVYFEDLNTGAWVGINERDEFIPASLLKVPIMITILKKVEKGEISLDQTVTLENDDIDIKSGTLGLKGPGYTLTVKDLLTYLVKQSDNTALLTLHRRFLNYEEITEAMLATGVPVNENNNYAIGPKAYSNILRSLYYSSYLRRAFSELALSIMSETDYNSQIPAGVPKDIPISHKIGFFYDDTGISGYNDCGIIYYPSKPYMLCVMSRNTDESEANTIISGISKMAYNYVNKNLG